MQHKLLLEMEYNCEKEEYRRQAEAMGLQRKVKRGDAWFPVSQLAQPVGRGGVPDAGQRD